MTGSTVFLLHLLGFGLLAGVTFAGWIVNGRFASTPEVEVKLVLGNLLRSVGLFSPIAALLLLATGIGNIAAHVGGGSIWYLQSWLVAKVVLFGILLTNGTILGPLIARKRMKVLRSLNDEGEAPSNEDVLSHLNGQMRWFYIVQAVLILGILWFSVFGPSRHWATF